MIRRRTLFAGLAAPAILKATEALACTCSGGTGPAASSSFLTVDYTSPYFYPTPGTQTQDPSRGQMIISPRLWGVIDGAFSNDGTEIGAFNDTTNGNPFALLTSPSYQTKMATVNPGIWTALTPPPGVWNFGTNPPSVAANGYTNLINNFYKLDPLGVSAIILNLNWRDLNITNQTTYGQMIHAMAVYFQNQIMPNGKRCPVIGFIGQNEPSPGDDLVGYYTQIVSNCKNVTLPGGGTYIVQGPCPDSVFLGTGNWASFSQSVPGIDVFQWDNFFEDGGFPVGGTPMSRLQTPQSSGGVSDWFSNGIQTQVSNTVAYQPTAYAPCGNMDAAVADPAMGDYRGAMWDALQRIQSANCSPVQAWNQKWDSALQGPAGFLLNTDPSPTNPITPAGYYNGRAVRTTTGPRWNITTNSANLISMACTSNVDITVMIVVAGQGAQNNKTVAFSHWPINSTGNGTLNVWQMTSANTADGTRTTVNVTAGVSQQLSFPDPSVTIISSIA